MWRDVNPLDLGAAWVPFIRVLRALDLAGPEEMVLTLWVVDVDGEWFDIKEGKTEAAARRVPIHADLQAIVKRRIEGKAKTDWLFHELRAKRDAGDTFGKRFKRFREAVGVDDRRAGMRRSLVNFHSARRRFTTKARHAGHPKEAIAEIVGHKPDKSDVTFSVYAKGASEGQLKACVGDVKLPAASCM
ncbi:tyrosine-type recombinase/integrase [Paracoccus sp. SY]|uniref:tyrosine-type recombinase/integrase n=1 Tax=Paracoccus sp. SY TaxID=1330255 RepID=UPI00195F2EE2|nr:tyrosine-type recombinase/integrase [Paracoccus sp. SY]